MTKFNQPAFLALDDKLENSIKEYFSHKDLPIRVFRSIHDLILATSSNTSFKPGFVMVGQNDQNKEELSELLDKIKFGSSDLSQVPVFVVSNKDDLTARELSYKKACTGYIVLPESDPDGNRVKMQNIFDFWSICERTKSFANPRTNPI